MPQEIPATTVGAAYGDAYLAGYAAGIFSDSKPLREKWVKIASTIEPNRDVTPVYDELYDIDHRLYRNTHEEMRYQARKFS